MTPSQHAIYGATVKPVPQAFLPNLEGKISPHDGVRRQQALEDHIGTEMHVMVAVKAGWVCSIEPTEFIELGGHYILKRIDQPRMKYHLGEAVSQ
jgi:hypothetical protein